MARKPTSKKSTRQSAPTSKKTPAHAPKRTSWHTTPRTGAALTSPSSPASYKPAKHTYDVHPGVAMTQDWINKLKEKTGRSLDQWLKLAKASGPTDEKSCRDWLKSEHNLGTNSAWWLAEKAHRPNTLSEDTPEQYLKTAQVYVEDMFAGPKSNLRPLYDTLVKLGRTLGKDVKLCPCKTIVPLYRNHVFAQIKPTTRTRIDLGFCLRGVKASGRLIDTGGQAKNDRITHRIEITTPNDIDDTVRAYLKQAYKADASSSPS